MWPNDTYRIARLPQQRYPGLSPEDSIILRYAIQLNVLPPGELYTNVHVGPGPGPDIAPQHRTLAAQLADNYRRRIDLVIDDVTHYWIIEIKPAASYVALGQALYYADLARTATNNAYLCHPAILCDAHDPDVQRAADTAGVTIWDIPGQIYEPRGHIT